MYRIAVTNRKLCDEDFLACIRRLADGVYYDAILLREKDLTETEYLKLAKEVKSICDCAGKTIILHGFPSVAEELHARIFHLPLSVWMKMSAQERSRLREKTEKLGTSVHSNEQLHQALELGADYVCAGHIFETDCKKGVPPRGLSFLRDICAQSPVPVYAIGGIREENENKAIEQGAAGVCVMSGAMKGKSK